MGEGVGGLLNATFGNAAELIIALAALRAGLHNAGEAALKGLGTLNVFPISPVQPEPVSR